MLYSKDNWNIVGYGECMEKVILFLGVYLAFGLWDFFILCMIDIRIHQCTNAEIKEEIGHYIKASIVWFVTMPIALVYVILTEIEDIRKEEFKDKELLVAKLSGVLFVLIIFFTLMSVLR